MAKINYQERSTPTKCFGFGQIIDTKKRKLDPDRFCDSPILIENIDLTPESPDCESDKSWEKVVDLLLNKQKAYNIKRSMTRLQEVSLPWNM